MHYIVYLPVLIRTILGVYVTILVIFSGISILAMIMILVCSIDTPNFDDSRAITADYPTPERRVNASQSRYSILVRFQQVLLALVDHRHALRWPMGSCGGPSLQVDGGRTI
jgi:hypothetical protein